MRIGMPTTSFPRDASDTAGRFVLELAMRLAERGHEIEVLAPEPKDDVPLPTLHPRVHLAWVPYVRPRSFSRTFYGAGVLENLSRDPGAWPGLVSFPLVLLAALRRAMPRWDAVVSHWALPCGLAAAWTCGARPHAAIVHSADAHLLSRMRGRERIASELSSRSTLFASSAATREVLLRSFGDPAPSIEVLPMGSDETVVSPRERKEARSALSIERFLALSVARLVPIKRVDLAIDAAALLPDATLALAGDGPLRLALEAQARGHGVDARFLGSVAPEVRRAWMAASDVVLLASTPRSSGRTEGTPVALLEALGAGIPVVASATGGVPEVVRHEENGLLVAPGDGRALGDALLRIYGDRALRERLGEGARALRAPTMRATAQRIEAALVSG